MLEPIIRWSITHRLLVLGVGAVLLVAGAVTALRMPVDVFPDLTAPTVTVLTEAHGMAPEEVEALVTFPLETAVNGATGVRRVRSSTAQGISIVWVEFDWGMDIFRARQIVNEKLQAASASLPRGVGPPILAPITSIMGEIMLIAVTGDGRVSPMEMRTVADWNIRRRVLAVPGVAQVVPLGGEVKQYQVLVDPSRLASFAVTLGDVLRAVEGSNVNASGGVFMDRGQEYLIRGTGRVQNVEDVANTVVAVRGGTPVLVADLATVRIGAATRLGEGSASGRRAVILTVQKQPGTNTLELTERIDAELAEIETTLPAGIDINRGIFRQADFIDTALANVLEALRDGAFLVVAILFLFLWSARTTFISVVAIPLSIVTAIFALQLLGITINTMTLGGMAIAVGALVDDAVIYVENAFRRLHQQRAPPGNRRVDTDAVVQKAAREILPSIVVATLIIVVVFVPLFFLSGIEGRMLRPLGIAYIVSILASLGVALTITSAFCSFLLPGARAVAADRESWISRNLKRAYRPLLGAVLKRPVPYLGAAAAVVLATVAVLPALGRSFLPEFQEGTLVVGAITIPGTSLDESDAIGRRIEEILLAHPAIAETARRTGRAELDEHAQGVNSAEIDVRMAEGYEYETVLEELRAALTAVPGTQITIGQPIGHRIDHMLSGTRASIAINLFGPDLYELRRLATEIEGIAQGVAGTVDVAAEQQADVPQARVVIDRAAMARHGVTPRDLAEAIDVAFAGETVSQVLEEQRSFDLVVRFDPGYRGSLDAIASARINTPIGTQVALGSLADIRYDLGPNAISRENVQRKIVVQANVAGRDVGSVVREIRGAVDRAVAFPPGYYVEYGGQFESAREATRTIGLLSLVSLAAILLLLLAEFGSVRQALLVMVNLPLALVGGVVAVVVTGGVLNVATLVGFITLFGIAVRNGILMVTHYNHLLDEEGATLRDAVFRGSMERLNPIMMTALTAGLALLPLALAGGEPGNEIQSPMAVVVLGGLLTSLALNMVVVPALYYRYGRRV